MRTANPIFTSDAFKKAQTWDDFERGRSGAAVRSPAGPVAAARPRTMTVSGTINAALVLLAITVAAAVGGWMLVAQNPGLIHPLWITGALGGLAVGFFLRFKPSLAIAVAPLYAVLEGAFLGPFSYVVAKFLGGPEIVFQGIALTFGTMFVLLIGYRAGLLRVSGTTARIVTVMTGAVMFVYLANFALHLFGVGQVPYLHELVRLEGAGWIGIGFSVLCLVLAAFNLVMDFQFIEEGANAGLPKHMEWYAAFGLLVTLIWLYIEIVRLLIKLRSSD
ncbi:MAG: Bax inhibitor-1/YccA family protein [Dehalococcoidia bacterium]